MAQEHQRPQCLPAGIREVIFSVYALDLGRHMLTGMRLHGLVASFYCWSGAIVAISL